MAFKTTSSLLRTNVKLSTNVKLNVTSDDRMYLNSFDDINTYIQSNKYKNVRVTTNSYYQYDLCKFWGDGNTPKEYIYQLKNDDDNVIKDSFDKQYLTDYCYGFEINTNHYFTEEYKFFAPLWIQDGIPDKFVIFRIKGGVYADVKEDIINNSELVKVFDLKDSNIGKYLNNYINQDTFPKYPLYVDYNDNNFTRYIGIDLERGGFVSSAEFNYDDFIKDTPMIYFENFISGGYERNKVAIANLINLEFLFDDANAGDDVYKYVGFYVYDNDEKSLDIISSAKIEEKILLNFDEPVLDYDLIKDNTSIYYLNTNNTVNKLDKDLSDNFTAQYKYLPGTDLKGIINYGDYILSEPAKPIIGRGRKYAILDVTGNIKHNNYLYIGKLLEERKIVASEDLVARTSDNRYFSNKGTVNDVIYAMKSAIEYSCPEIIVVVYGTTMLVCLREWKITDTYDFIYLNESIIDNSISVRNDGEFIGKFDGTKNKFKITASNKSFIEENINELFVRTTTGYTQINKIYLNLENPVVDYGENLIGFENLENSLILEFKDIPQLLNNQLYFYKKQKCTIGRFSFVNIVDFDYDFHSVEYYKNSWDWFYLNLFYVNKEMDETIYLPWIHYNNNNYPSKKIEYIDNKNYLEVINVLTTIHNNELYGGNSTPIKSAIISDIILIKSDFYQYMYANSGIIIEFDLVINSLKEVNFVQYDYFKKLTTILGNDNNGVIDGNIVNEYDRLKENYTKEYATVSRTVPYITKWVKEFNDIKEKKYRLNTNLAFGVDNFTPSFEVKIPTPQFFTHEWYYLGEFPKTNNKIIGNFIANNPNFYNEIENIDGFFDNNFSLDEYKKNNRDYFYEYFTIEKVTYNNEDGDIDAKYINPKKRFSTFVKQNRQDFSQTFFRGVKLYVKTLKNFETINSNLNSLEYVYNDEFKDYKFSAVLQPSYYEYDVVWNEDHEITNITALSENLGQNDVNFQVIKNEKYKHVLFLITVKIPYINSLTDNKITLDYNLLYNLKSFSRLYDGEIEYLPTPLSGAIDLSNPFPGGIYQGIKNNTGANTKFTTEVVPGDNGVYGNSVYVFEANPFGLDILRYKLNNISSVLSDDRIKIGSPIEVILAPIESSDEYYKRTNLFIENGGKNYFSRLFEEISFANIYELVNFGSNKIKYSTIKTDGTVLEGITNYILEFEKPDSVNIVNKLTTTEDINKPNSLLLTNDIIGYSYTTKEGNNMVNINRYKGYYYPKFTDIIKFTDIGLQEADKNKNLQIDFSDIGIIKNYYYNKTSLKTSKNILTVNTDNFKPLYPLVNEIAIDKFDKNIFLTTWNDNYFIASYGKNDDRFVSGSFSDIDEKTFFGGKTIHTIEGFGLDVLSADEILYAVTGSNLKIDINLEKSIVSYFYEYVDSILSEYIDYTQTQYPSKEEYINNYILKNILPKYYLANIDFYVLETKDKQPYDLVNVTLSKEEKINAGFKKINNYTSNFISNSFFNKSIITTIAGNSNYRYYAIGVNIAKHKYR